MDKKTDENQNLVQECIFNLQKFRKLNKSGWIYFSPFIRPPI